MPSTRRKRAPVCQPVAVKIVWDEGNLYRVGPAVECDPEQDRTGFLFCRAYKPSVCHSRFAARQAVSRWKNKIGLRLVVGEALLEGR